MHVCRRIVEITARGILSPLRISTDLDYTPSPNSRRDSALINHANRAPFARAKRKKGDEVSPGLNYPLILVILRATKFFSPRRKAIFNLHIVRGEGLICGGEKVGSVTVRMIEARFRVLVAV